MNKNNDSNFELEIQEDTAKLIKEHAKKTGQTEEQFVEYILSNFLQNQLHVIEKRAKELNGPLDKLLSMQFAKLVEYVVTYKK
ncbi:hypothetical protein M1M92_00335 [Peptococcaceae bacterium]|nr:hypothetical protein [Peptococcaceae bacterium]